MTRISAPSPRKIRRWLEMVERTWLGWSLPPARRAIGDARWQPDDPQRYCGLCGVSVGRDEVTPRGCASCRGTSPATDRVIRLGPYADPLGEWVKSIKYRQWDQLGRELGRRLGKSISAALAGTAGGGGAGYLVVPMPMPWQRRLYRGIDHARVIAGGVAAELHAPLLALLAQANGPPQVSQSATQRSRNSGRMRLKRSARLLPLDARTIILVDDVRTSGASLETAARLIRRLGAARVVAGVLAVADPVLGPPARLIRVLLRVDRPLRGARIASAGGKK